MWGGGGSDRLIGADGNDYLDGSEGIDHLEGGAGNDVYITDDASDVVVEVAGGGTDQVQTTARSEEHTSELQSLMRTSYAVFCLKKKNTTHKQHRQSATVSE